MIKKILIIIFIFLPSISFSARELETGYPDPSGGEVGKFESVFHYVKYIFEFSIWIIGAIAFVLLVKAGVTYLSSAGSPSKIKDAKDQILSIIIGMAILFGSVFILNTINPELTKFEGEELEKVQETAPELQLKTSSPDPLVRIKELSEQIKDEVVPSLLKKNKELKELVEKCNCAYSSSKCDCFGWNCAPAFGDGGGCACKLVNDAVPNLSSSATGQVLSGLEASTLEEIASMVPGISSDDLLSDLEQYGTETIEKIKEAMTNINDPGELALAILDLENFSEELSCDCACNCASNILNLSEIDVENILSGISEEEIKDFFLNLTQIPDPKELISSFSKENLGKIAEGLSFLSSENIEEVFSSFSPETIKDIASNFSSTETIDEIIPFLNEETIRNTIKGFSNVPSSSIKNDISTLSKEDLVGIISEIPENNLEEIASKISDVSPEDLISDPFSLSKETLETALTETFKLPDQETIFNNLPLEKIKKIASSISEANMEDILSFLPESTIKNIAEEFLNFSPEKAKSILPVETLEEIAGGMFSLPSDVLSNTLSNISQEEIVEIIKDFSKISPDKIQDVINSLPESDVKDFLSSIKDEDIKEIIGEEKIPLENLKEFSSSCQGDPCFNREEIIEKQREIVLITSQLVYYKNRLDSEREDTRSELDHFIFWERLTEGQANNLEKHLENIIDPLEEISSISFETSNLPNQCIAPEKCQGNCGGGCHDGCEGTKACYPKACSGGNPCPVSEMEKNINKMEDKQKEINKLCNKIISILK